jgi:hypothetical protein
MDETSSWKARILANRKAGTLDDFDGTIDARLKANREAGILDDFTGTAGVTLARKLRKNREAGTLDDFTGEAEKIMNRKLAERKRKRQGKKNVELKLVSGGKIVYGYKAGGKV